MINTSINWKFDENGLSLNELRNDLELIKHKPASIMELPEDKILSIIYHWHKVLVKQRMLIDLPDSKILVVGDIHGDLLQTQKALYLLDSNEVDYVVFNGDVVDRGPEMVESLALIIVHQLQNTSKVCYIRGNHEIQAVNAVYGFRGYCTALFGSRCYKYFSSAFRELPLAMKIGQWAFITHGGVPRDTVYFHLMRLELKPKELEKGAYSELIWNDPDERIKEFASSNRGSNCYRFGQNAFDRFMDFHNLDLFVRAHQAFPEGYRWLFNKRLLSIFSSRAGPYSRVDPHYARLQKGEISLIRADDVQFGK